MTPFHAIDAETLVQYSQELTPLHQFPMAYWEALAQWPSWAGRVEGQLVACGGLVQPWAGSAECWLATTPLVYRHVVSFHRAVKRVLLEAAARWSLYRVSVTVREDFYSARQWITRLGFAYEARLRCYGPTQATHIQYVWFPYGVS